MNKYRLRIWISLALLGSWAVILRLLDFPILPFVPFLKFDFSDLMVYVGMLIGGPKGLMLVAGIRDLSNYIMKGGEGGIPIGVIMSFIASVTMFLPSHFFLKSSLNKNRLVRIFLTPLSLVVMLCLVMSLMNYYIALPIYAKVMKLPIDHYLNYVIQFILPFNAIKGVLIAACQGILNKYIRPILEQKKYLYPLYDQF